MPQFRKATVYMIAFLQTLLSLVTLFFGPDLWRSSWPMVESLGVKFLILAIAFMAVNFVLLVGLTWAARGLMPSNESTRRLNRRGTLVASFISGWVCAMAVSQLDLSFYAQFVSWGLALVLVGGFGFSPSFVVAFALFWHDLTAAVNEMEIRDD